MNREQKDRDQTQTLQEYRDAIRAARTALDELEREVEEELGPDGPDGENHEEG